MERDEEKKKAIEDRVNLQAAADRNASLSPKRAPGGKKKGPKGIRLNNMAAINEEDMEQIGPNLDHI